MSKTEEQYIEAIERFNNDIASLRKENTQLRDETFEARKCAGDVLDEITKLEAENKELREQVRWVPVSERLPEEETPVLAVGTIGGKSTYLTTAMVIYEDDGCGHAGWVWCQLCDNYNPNLWDKSAYKFDDDYEYLAWMPLPPPPQEPINKAALDDVTGYI